MAEVNVMDALVPRLILMLKEGRWPRHTFVILLLIAIVRLLLILLHVHRQSRWSTIILNWLVCRRILCCVLLWHTVLEHRRHVLLQQWLRIWRKLRLLLLLVVICGHTRVTLGVHLIFLLGCRCLCSKIVSFLFIHISTSQRLDYGTKTARLCFDLQISRLSAARRR